MDMRVPAEIFCCHAEADAAFVKSLELQLAQFVRERGVSLWHEGLVPAGIVREEEVAAHLQSAAIIVLLVSADLLSYEYDRLVAPALARHRGGEVHVVPVIVRPCDWTGSALGAFRALPTGRPVSLWPDQDAAWLDVVHGLRALLPTSINIGAAPAREREREREIFDFSSERSRHRTVQGRDEALEQLDRWMLEEDDPRYVLVTGGPGFGKSALLSEWLRRRERAGDIVPHHFLRRGHRNWDQPALVLRNLSARIERLFPAQRDADAEPEQRLVELLGRVSAQVLLPERRRLLLLIDGLDEAAGVGNPLPQFVPYALPPGVLLLCASRPTYPGLPWLEARDGLVRMDLDGPRWAASNDSACRAFWSSQRFEPPLHAWLIEEALERGAGNLLYAVKMAERLRATASSARRVELLPRGLDGYLHQVWEGLSQLGRERSGVLRGLGLLCAARDALPLSVLDGLLGGLDAREALLRASRPVLLEEPAEWRAASQDRGNGEAAYRPYHDSFRGFLAAHLGAEQMRAHHVTLAEQLARWPAEGAFRRRYALRHAVSQHADAGLWDTVYALCLDTRYLQARLSEVGQQALEDDIEQAARRCPDLQRRSELLGVVRALRAASHWLRAIPEELPMLLHNGLVSRGWSAECLAPLLTIDGDAPQLWLRHPLQSQETAERVLQGHTFYVAACAIGPDGRRALSASGDETLRVWDLLRGHSLHELQGHSSAVVACVFNPDRRRVLSASHDHTLRVWDLVSGRCLHVLEGHSDGVNACALSGDGRRALSASHDHTLRVWDLESGRCLHVLQGHSDRVISCVISSDDRKALSASHDHTLRVWDLESGHCLHVLQGHSDRVNACTISPDDRRVLSASDDGTLRLWNLHEGGQVQLLRGHDKRVHFCVISPDGQRALSASADCTLRTWDLESGQCLHVLRGHRQPVDSCAISPDGRRALSASDDGTLRTWSLESDQCQAVLEGHSSTVGACAISPDGRRALSASDDGTLRVWDLDVASAPQGARGHSGPIQACVVSQDGRRALSASHDHTLRVWDLDSGAALHVLQGHWAPVVSCAMSLDGRRALSTSHDRTLRVWDLDSGAILHVMKGHSAAVVSCAMSLDGRRALSASHDHTLRVWDLDSGAPLHVLEGHSAFVRRCTISPDGARAVSTCNDNTLRVWDLDSGRCLHVLRGHGSMVLDCAITPDGQRALSASSDKTLRVWDLDDGRCIDVLQGHAASIHTCAISQDGQRAVSASSDRTLRSWDIDGGQVLHKLEGHSNIVHACAFSPDGHLAVSASEDRTLRVWDLDSGRSLCVLLGNNPFSCLAFAAPRLVAGDQSGNLWFLELRNGPLSPRSSG
ncbi:MAG: AAA family ATPase [Myxococcales bacterium]|nr:AAA family ATPase [Myxococcales bacterium]